LVNSVVPLAELDAEVDRLAGKIVAKPRGVIAAGKAIFYQQLEAGLAEAYRAASASITRNMLGEDAAEGVGAFIDKREPRWR
jgi:enoyl-CoA hydratase/carnithine racemase